MTENLRTLVAVATYNEIENLPRLVEEVYRHAPHAEILVVDDNSPDGTGRWCDERAASDERLHVLHRPTKSGLGSATLAAMRFAIDHEYELLLTLDADFSHPPEYIPDLIAGMQAGGDGPVDVMIGSRYIPGGGVQGWPLIRRLLSRLVNVYARWLLNLKPKDCSGAFRCFRVDVLRKLDLEAICSQGYSFFEEILWRLRQEDAQFRETPIVFVNRRRGRSKISLWEGVVALWVLFRLGMQNWFGRRDPPKG